MIDIAENELNLKQRWRLKPSNLKAATRSLPNKITDTEGLPNKQELVKMLHEAGSDFSRVDQVSNNF